MYSDMWEQDRSSAGPRWSDVSVRRVLVLWGIPAEGASVQSRCTHTTASTAAADLGLRAPSSSGPRASSADSSGHQHPAAADLGPPVPATVDLRHPAAADLGLQTPRSNEPRAPSGNGDLKLLGRSWTLGLQTQARPWISDGHSRALSTSAKGPSMGLEPILGKTTAETGPKHHLVSGYLQSPAAHGFHRFVASSRQQPAAITGPSAAEPPHWSAAMVTVPVGHLLHISSPDGGDLTLAPCSGPPLPLSVQPLMAAAD
ncbi:uncharacterized protein [Narcine bancroftii]|uniref:uncharacterized protein n=1 Tax=Narcine bancroftii TaxID=1343680 RepID=UPI0038312D7C